MNRNEIQIELSIQIFLFRDHQVQLVDCGSVKIHSSEVFTTASNLGQKNDADGKKGVSVENQSAVQILIPNEHRSPSIAIMYPCQLGSIPFKLTAFVAD